jgi:hypothetical protein
MRDLFRSYATFVIASQAALIRSDITDPLRLCCLIDLSSIISIYVLLLANIVARCHPFGYERCLRLLF